MSTKTSPRKGRKAATGNGTTGKAPATSPTASAAMKKTGKARSATKGAGAGAGRK